MTQIDVNLLIMVLVGTLSGLYGMSRYYQFRVSENRKQREHLQKQRKTKMEFELEGKKLGKSGDVDKLIDKFDIKSLLSGVEDEDDIDDLPIPSWLKPIAKGFLTKFMDKTTDSDKSDSDLFEK